MALARVGFFHMCFLARQQWDHTDIFLEMSITKVHCKLAKLETTMLTYSTSRRIRLFAHVGEALSSAWGGGSSFLPFTEELDAEQ